MRGPVIASLAVAVLVTACASDRADEPAAPVDAAGLRDAIAASADEDVAVATFVLDGDLVAVGDEDRLFAFDSITKTVTGLVLARLAEAGTVAMDAPVGDLLDAGPNGDITLEQLATHTSGLPRLAPNADEWDGFDIENPYAGFTAEMAEAGLRGAERGESEYSNFGYQLLGLALERATDRPLGELAAQLVFGPAGMSKASLPQTPGALEPGSRKGEPAPAWDEQLGGAGGAIGTIGDLAAYARFLLSPPPEARSGVEFALQPRSALGAGDTGLGWITTDGLTWHNGGSAGYSSLIVLDRAGGRAAGFLVADGEVGREAEPLVFDLLRARRGT